MTSDQLMITFRAKPMISILSILENPADLQSILILHPKLRNIDSWNVTHSLISQNPREQMFLVQISLLMVTFFSLISRVLPLMQTTIEGKPHPRIVPCVNMWSVFFFFFICHLLNCWCMDMSHCLRRPSGFPTVSFILNS